MGKPQFIQIVFRVFLLVINGIILYVMYSKNFIINFIGFFLFFIFQMFLFNQYLKKLFIDIEKSIDCLLHNDYSNTISKEKRKNPLHNKTALLLEKYRKQSFLNTSDTLILTNIMESLSIGILILRKDINQEIEVFQINKAFINFLKIPRFYNWKILKEKIGGLSNFISKWEILKHTVSLEVNENKESFFLKTSVTQTNQYEYLVVSLETIQQLIDKKEKEAWYKLMNVMSHEIINTITPISSLAENLDSLLQEDQTNIDTIDELSEGLQIIKRRSRHLTSFVDTYRQLAELPLPKKDKVDLNKIVLNTLQLFEQEFLSKGILIKYQNIKKIIINADSKQIEQVLINLISNSMHALIHIKKPIIKISITESNHRVNLTVTDNGIGIPEEIKDNVFIPYFTTRKDGSGIGLTLSKSIMEAHNGKVLFNSKKGNTNFILTFIN